MPIERRCSISMAVPTQDEAQHTAAKACQRCHRTISTTNPLDSFTAAQFAGAVNFCYECRTNEPLWPPFELPEIIRRAAGVAKEPQYDNHEIDVSRRLLRRPDDADALEEEEVVGDDNIDSDAEMNGDRVQSDDIGNPRCPRPAGQLSVTIPPQRAHQHPHQQHARDLSPAASPSRLKHPPRSPVRARAYSPIPHGGLQRWTKGDKNDGYPDPIADISRLRVRSKGHKCLYPGARFEGTQKSGRNSYDVNVNIVDVDFASSYLCGYLCIKGLTEDWPELTTYFDAQIIGDRYGFVTDAWGASEKEDLVHWTRFPAFGAVKSDAEGSKMLLPNNTSRSAIFMRWKEHFLVPDHKVEDISGASFAGEIVHSFTTPFASLTFNLRILLCLHRPCTPVKASFIAGRNNRR